MIGQPESSAVVIDIEESTRGAVRETFDVEEVSVGSRDGGRPPTSDEWLLPLRKNVVTPSSSPSERLASRRRIGELCGDSEEGEARRKGIGVLSMSMSSASHSSSPLTSS